MKINAENVLKDMISLLTSYLNELSDISDTPGTQFAYGEKTAYTECLEILSTWDQAEENGLDFDIERRFPL
ncbi:MAG: hypothetical protein IJ308_04000 [Clostridia bacterium]|nr:hypothetical protein [Clostridia bacterium]